MDEVWDPALEQLRVTEAAYVSEDGDIEVWAFGQPPTTQDIAERLAKLDPKRKRFRLVVEKAGEEFVVYDLRTLRRDGTNQVWSMESPVIQTTTLDGAVMAGLLLS